MYTAVNKGAILVVCEKELQSHRSSSYCVDEASAAISLCVRNRSLLCNLCRWKGERVLVKWVSSSHRKKEEERERYQHRKCKQKLSKCDLVSLPKRSTPNDGAEPSDPTRGILVSSRERQNSVERYE
jgi:hypothetical protein